MKKNVILAGMFGLMTVALASCSDDSGIIPEVQKPDITTPDHVKLITDQSQLASRLVFVNRGAESKASRAVKETPAPSIPEGALKLADQPTNWNNGVTLTRGKSYYIDEAWEGTISQDWAGTGSIDIYMSADAKIVGAWWNDDTPVNIYILPDAVMTYCEAGWDNKVKIKKATNVYCWGNVDTPENMGFRLYEGGKLYMYGTEGEPFVVRNNGDQYSAFQVDIESDFYCEREMIVNGTALFNGGKSHLVNKLTVIKDMYVEQLAKITLDDCSYVMQELDFKSALGAVVNVNKYLQSNTLLTNQGKATMNLKDALFEIVTDGMFVDKGDQRVVVNGVESDYKSIVKVGGKLYLDRGNEYTTMPGDVAAVSFPSGNFTGDLNLEGELRVKFYYDVPDEKAVLTEDNLVVPESVSIHANSWLPASEDGCRSEVGEVPVVEVLPPTPVPTPTPSPSPSVSHKYSATGIAFNGNTVYLCWHSNPETNMDYAQGNFSPSVSGKDDFGGIIDVININTYDITNSLFEQSMENNEFKYNHIMFSDNKLYSATTNKKVGAALSEITLTSSGKFPALEQFEEVRVNLTGYSANCVERIGDELVTISGYSNGGINKFALDDNSNQEKKFINDATEGFQGKYVYYNKSNGKVVTLNNTSKGIVTVYNSSMQPETSFETGAINPIDGKNVCICDNNYIYVCKGQNGFGVYDYSGNQVGGSKKHTNGVDVDDKYIYLAAGDGLAILDKHATYVDADGNTYNRTIKKFNYTGKGATSVTDETTVKQSANFVKKGPDGRIYVAYGMYGLQIYDLN